MFKIKGVTSGGVYEVEFFHPAAPGHLVGLSGTFNDWDYSGTQLEYNPVRNGYAGAILLAPGNYEYKFVIDGEWFLDDDNPDFNANDFGTLNSVAVIR